MQFPRRTETASGMFLSPYLLFLSILITFPIGIPGSTRYKQSAVFHVLSRVQVINIELGQSLGHLSAHERCTNSLV